jgi:hypothetical protein
MPIDGVNIPCVGLLKSPNCQWIQNHWWIWTFKLTSEVPTNIMAKGGPFLSWWIAMAYQTQIGSKMQIWIGSIPLNGPPIKMKLIVNSYGQCHNTSHMMALRVATSRKPMIYDWCLRLVFSRRRHFTTILLLVA